MNPWNTWKGKLDAAIFLLSKYSDAVRWKTLGVLVVIGGDNLPSPVEIGLTDLPNIGGPVARLPPPPVLASLKYQDKLCGHGHPSPFWKIAHTSNLKKRGQSMNCYETVISWLYPKFVSGPVQVNEQVDKKWIKYIISKIKYLSMNN